MPVARETSSILCWFNPHDLSQFDSLNVPFPGFHRNLSFVFCSHILLSHIHFPLPSIHIHSNIKSKSVQDHLPLLFPFSIYTPRWHPFPFPIWKNPVSTTICRPGTHLPHHLEAHAPVLRTQQPCHLEFHLAKKGPSSGEAWPKVGTHGFCGEDLQQNTICDPQTVGLGVKKSTFERFD